MRTLSFWNLMALTALTLTLMQSLDFLRTIIHRPRERRDPSNTDVIQSTALKKLQTAPRGSIGIPAVQALLARSGSLSKFTTASRETNSGFRKAGRSVSSSAARKTLKAKGKERMPR